MFDWIFSSWNQVKPLLVPFGGIAAIIISVSAFISKFFVDRSIEKKKSELGRVTERLKNDLSQELANLTAQLTRETNDELERLRSTLGRESDSFRLKLKKQELLFNMQLDATREFMKLSYQIWPAYSHPDMDWDEAITETSKNLYKTEKIITEYIVKYGAVLDDVALSDITTLRNIASNYKFDVHESNPEEVVIQAKSKTEELLMEIKKIEKLLLDRIRNQLY